MFNLTPIIIVDDFNTARYELSNINITFDLLEY
jgi:hypothetical protein